jgi:hypothetical protein
LVHRLGDLRRQSDLTLAILRGPLSRLEIVGAISPAFALLHSYQMATDLALLVTAPAVASGIYFRTRVSAFEIEMKVSASNLIELFDFRGQIPLESVEKWKVKALFSTEQSVWFF